MVFSGCLTRPPGTSTRHHPHEPTTSKPVVPGDALHLQCSPEAQGAADVRTKRRGSKPLEEPAASGPRAFCFGWRGLTPRWPRSLRLGSASEFKVARRRAGCKGCGRLMSLVPDQKNDDSCEAGESDVRVHRTGAWKPLGSAYGPWHNGCMDDGELSLPRPTPALQGAPVTALQGAPISPGGYPSERPFAGENPFGGEQTSKTGGAGRSLRKRIGSVVAAIGALFAKFFA